MPTDPEQPTRQIAAVRDIRPQTDPALRRSAERMARLGRTDRVADQFELAADHGPATSAPPRSAQRVNDRHLAAHRNHLERIDRMKLARAIVQLVLAIVLLLIAVAAGTLVVGALLGAWTLPVGSGEIRVR